MKSYQHLTKDGSMYVYEMDDNHLKNTIELYLRKLQESRNIIDDSNDEFNKVLYGTADIDAAKRFIGYFMEAFPFYFMEMAIRDSELAAKYGKQLSKILNRNTWIDRSSYQRLIEESEPIDDF